MEKQTKHQDNRLMVIGVLIAAAIVLLASNYRSPSAGNSSAKRQTAGKNGANTLEEIVIPREGIILPVRWGDLGARMAAAGVIDGKKIEELYAARGGLTDETKRLFNGSGNGNLKITTENGAVILNLLWALGLANKNDVLTSGPMADPRYGGAGRFASTGGWTLASGNAMEHYGAHEFVKLSPAEQSLVERAAKNIYRPCCGNSAYFPDCNHGMAMLGLLELMAAQGVSENDMYKAALAVNSFWFPDTYLTIARYLASKGIDWREADPRGILAANFSSASGYRAILAEIAPVKENSGGSCGV